MTPLYVLTSGDKFVHMDEDVRVVAKKKFPRPHEQFSTYEEAYERMNQVETLRQQLISDLIASIPENEGAEGFQDYLRKKLMKLTELNVIITKVEFSHSPKVEFSVV